MEGVCNQMIQIEHYDLSASVKGSSDGVPWGESPTLKASAADDDYQAITTAENGETYDFIRVGDVGYVRDSRSGNAWKLAGGPLRDIDEFLGDLGDSPICPELTEVTWKGEEELNGIKVTLYTSGEGASALDDVDSDFRGSEKDSSHEVWVDGSGQLAQHRHSLYELSQDDEGNGTAHTVVLSTFLDVGEPNTITAPMV